ncbi:MAG: hypothetical protein DME60_03820 [Verrucomicrobia bacterium]|nr:MAG: hypothetical protein DME60_03820 [Verrucomicrobiota bacterium]
MRQEIPREVRLRFGFCNTINVAQAEYFFLFAAVRVPDRKTFARTARTLRQRSVVVRRHLHQSKMIHWPVRDSSPPLGMTPQRGMIYLWCQFLVDLVRL